MEPTCFTALPEPTDDIEQGKKNLDRAGVTIHKNLLSAEQVEILRSRLEEQAALECEAGVASFAFEASDNSNGRIVGDSLTPHIGRPIKPPPFQRVTFLVNKGQVFIELAKHPVALTYTQHVLRNTPFNIGSQTGVIIRKGALAQPIHVDQFSIPFWTPMPTALGMMIALGEYEEDMGATRLLPGSHLCPPPDGAAAVGLKPVPVVLEPGSAAFWDSRLWHGQGSSFSEKTRVSIATYYMAHFMKTLECYVAGIHDDVYETMTEEERALYGFDYTGYCGLIGPRHANDTRSNVQLKSPYIPALHRKSGT
jgi:ectoine hydroxylase-related dioxygenase (phytanoyl-CoA dioxygenase family)